MILLNALVFMETTKSNTIKKQTNMSPIVNKGLQISTRQTG